MVVPGAGRVQFEVCLGYMVTRSLHKQTSHAPREETFTDMRLHTVCLLILTVSA